MPAEGYVGFMDYGCWAGTRPAPTLGRFSTVSRCESRPTGLIRAIRFIDSLTVVTAYGAPMNRDSKQYAYYFIRDSDNIQNQSAVRIRSVNSSSTVIARGPSGLSILLTIVASSSLFSSSFSSSMRGLLMNRL